MGLQATDRVQRALSPDWVPHWLRTSYTGVTRVDKVYVQCRMRLVSFTAGLFIIISVPWTLDYALVLVLHELMLELGVVGFVFHVTIK